jgi:hypothetical protein
MTTVVALKPRHRRIKRRQRLDCVVERRVVAVGQQRVREAKSTRRERDARARHEKRVGRAQFVLALFATFHQKDLSSKRKTVVNCERCEPASDECAVLLTRALVVRLRRI